MNSLKARLVAWYDTHFAAAWYRSSAMWTGILAGLVQFAPGWIQSALDQFDLLSGAFQWSTQTKIIIQSVLLFVVLPAAKAMQQKSIREATLKQAVKTGEVTTNVGTDAVQINVGKEQ
ncbi:hypothetical protein WIX39_026115 [Variovorax sp. AB1(2024)]|uniref:hypothetical protein n=1 Tax=Variovorax sp. AB1(2024) TaxID=3132214 RepID=UPI0030961DDB